MWREKVMPASELQCSAASTKEAPTVCPEHGFSVLAPVVFTRKSPPPVTRNTGVVTDRLPPERQLELVACRNPEPLQCLASNDIAPPLTRLKPSVGSPRAPPRPPSALSNVSEPADTESAPPAFQDAGFTTRTSPAASKAPRTDIEWPG